MTLTKVQKKYVHAAINGFSIGALTAAQLAFQGGVSLLEKKAWLVIAAAVLAGGVSKMAGAIIDAMNTTDSPK